MHFSALSGTVCLISDLAGASCHNVTFTPSTVLRRPHLYKDSCRLLCASSYSTSASCAIHSGCLLQCLTSTMGNLDWEISALTQASHVPPVLPGISLGSQCPGIDIPGQAMHRACEMLLGFRPLSHPSTLQPKPLKPLKFITGIPLLLCAQRLIRRRPLYQTLRSI